MKYVVFPHDGTPAIKCSTAEAAEWVKAVTYDGRASIYPLEEDDDG